MIIVIFAYKLFRGGNDGKLLKISRRERERAKRGPSEKEKWGGGGKAADSDGEKEEEEEGGVEPSRQKLQV